MHDHRAGDRRGWPDEQRREVLFDPREPASVRLLRSRMVVEDADRRHRVVRRIDHIIGHETFDITDDRNGTLLDPACQLFGHASLCFALTNGGVHGLLPHRRLPAVATTATVHHAQNRRGASSRVSPYTIDPTPFPATASEKAPERTSTPRQESRDGCVSGMLSLQLQKSPTPNFEEKCGNSSDISKGISQSGMCKFESSEVSQAVTQLEIV